MKTAFKIIGGITLVAGEAFLVKCTLIAFGVFAYHIDQYGINDGMDKFQTIVNRGLKTRTVVNIGEKYAVKDVINYRRNKKK